jgi:amino acid transporter
MPKSALGIAKQLIVGARIPSRLGHRERFTRGTGLAVLASDALSSVAYATEEILRTLLVAGLGALWLTQPIGFVICGLLIVIVLSYRQTIHAYPGGGGAYRVAKENLGTNMGLVAAAALLTDYVMTVSVSIAAGVAAVTSAFPDWHVNRVQLALFFVALIAIGNLRGIRQSGNIFALPTYFFIGSMLFLIAQGVWQVWSGTAVPVVQVEAPLATTGSALTLFLVLRAFSNGCTALTGLEAVSDGVPAFEPPEATNAAATMMIMAVLSIVMFLGITLLAGAYAIVPMEEETVVSQLARAVFGGLTVSYYVIQVATTLILVLAANTAYADFPRLASILARDRFLPRQLANQGDRLAFSNGIFFLSLLAGGLLVAFGGDTHALIPLYMVGVFVSFSLSQGGMVLKWRRERGPGWVSKATVNAVGAVLCIIVLTVVGVTKFGDGAWIILTVIPVLVLGFRAIHRHYQRVASQLSLADWSPPAHAQNVILVPISDMHRAVVTALQYARSIGSDIRAVYVDVERRTTERIEREWSRYSQGIPLVVLPSPYRSILEPLMEYIDRVQREYPDAFVTILLPEFIPARWWHHLLHNQRALLIKGALLFKRNVIVTDVPFHLQR